MTYLDISLYMFYENTSGYLDTDWQITYSTVTNFLWHMAGIDPHLSSDFQNKLNVSHL